VKWKCETYLKGEVKKMERISKERGGPLERPIFLAAAEKVSDKWSTFEREEATKRKKGMSRRGRTLN